MEHCLIIDDSDVIRRYSRLIFESLGYRVSEAANPDEAMERLKSDVPQMILVDWRIPKADMHLAIANIRRMGLNPRPCIMYVTTENDYIDVELAMKAGADGHILKPFNRTIFELKLREMRIAA